MAVSDEDLGNTEVLEETLVEDEPEKKPEEAEAKVTEETKEEAELVVAIGDTPSPEDKEAPEWVKELRKQNREINKRNRELEAQISKLNNPQIEELGEKPSLENCDYDAEKFEQELTAYQERKIRIEAAQKEQLRSQQVVEDEFNASKAKYEAGKVSLGVKDYGEAEATVIDTLSQIQQNIIVAGAENSSLVVYALGKNPHKAQELAKIKDPVKFAFAVAKLEGQLKVTKKASAPVPEKVVRSEGGKSIALNADKELERLRGEAEKTGDYSKVVSYKNSLKQRSA